MDTREVYEGWLYNAQFALTSLDDFLGEPVYRG